MNRLVLEEMLKIMKKNLRDDKDIGNVKIGALFALGNQLQAIFYFLGHELGSKLDDFGNVGDIVQKMEKTSALYHLGTIIIKEKNNDHITFSLKQCGSCKELTHLDQKIGQGLCSFEAGIFAGIVERCTGKHCFAQELACSLENKTEMCEFIIVIPQE